MRSFVPIPGNPWPHDMVITVDDAPQALVDLLWIREAWNLKPTGGDLPPLLSDTSVGAHAHAHAEQGDKIAWHDAWPALWEARLQHDGLILDTGLFAQLEGTADGSAERADLLHRIMGPTWRDTFGAEAFTDQYRIWEQSTFAAISSRHPRSLEEAPERVSLAALVPAWQAGLQKIVAIPCRGSYTRVIGQHALLVTVETRDDPRRYSEALNQFL